MLVIRTMYDQQFTMFQNQFHTIGHRIVNMHQPQLHQIVLGKAQVKEN
jgi:hypothetical protein